MPEAITETTSERRRHGKTNWHIRQALSDKKMRQKDLALFLNVSEAYVSKVLRGVNRSRDARRRIALILNIDVEDAW